MTQQEIFSHEKGKSVYAGDYQELGTANLSGIRYNASLAKNLQILSDFCALRNCPLLPEEVKNYFHGQSANAIILFGGSILEGMDVFAGAIQNHIAECSIIVGGYGHTSQDLLAKISALTGKPYSTEAEAFNDLMQKEYGVQADYLETRSTNCGNNIDFLYALLLEKGIPADNLIFIQDASMQRRMDATALKEHDSCILNYAASKPQFCEQNGFLDFENPPRGMWDIRHYIQLVTGEIERLMDTAEGYGPKGKGYIAHVDIPPAVLQAYQIVRKLLPDTGRMANPAFENPVK